MMWFQYSQNNVIFAIFDCIILALTINYFDSDFGIE